MRTELIDGIEIVSIVKNILIDSEIVNKVYLFCKTAVYLCLGPFYFVLLMISFLYYFSAIVAAPLPALVMIIPVSVGIPKNPF